MLQNLGRCSILVILYILIIVVLKCWRYNRSSYCRNCWIFKKCLVSSIALRVQFCIYNLHLFLPNCLDFAILFFFSLQSSMFLLFLFHFLSSLFSDDWMTQMTPYGRQTMGDYQQSYSRTEQRSYRSSSSGASHSSKVVQESYGGSPTPRISVKSSHPQYATQQGEITIFSGKKLFFLAYFSTVL